MQIGTSKRNVRALISGIADLLNSLGSEDYMAWPPEYDARSRRALPRYDFHGHCLP